MKENKRGCGCAVTAVIVGLILLVAGALAGWYLLGKYKPSTELADKGKLFGIKSGQVALVLDNELQDTKAIYEDNQVYLPVDWVNEYLNQRFYWMRMKSFWCMRCRIPLSMRMPGQWAVRGRF